MPVNAARVGGENMKKLVVAGLWALLIAMYVYVGGVLLYIGADAVNRINDNLNRVLYEYETESRETGNR